MLRERLKVWFLKGVEEGNQNYTLPYANGLILHEKGNHSSTMNFRVKNKQTNQTKTETILPLLSTAFLYGSNHSGKVASPRD